MIRRLAWQQPLLYGGHLQDSLTSAQFISQRKWLSPENSPQPLSCPLQPVITMEKTWRTMIKFLQKNISEAGDPLWFDFPMINTAWQNLTKKFWPVTFAQITHSPILRASSASVRCCFILSSLACWSARRDLSWTNESTPADSMLCCCCFTRENTSEKDLWKPSFKTSRQRLWKYVLRYLSQKKYNTSVLVHIDNIQEIFSLQGCS